MPPRSRIAVVVKGWPRLSETFIAQEILGLERRGLSFLIVALRRPTDPFVHAMHDKIAAEILYLPEFLKDDPARVRAGRAAAAAMPGYRKAERLYRADLAHDPSPSRHRRWGQAAVLAAELPADVRHIHVHYLHTPGSVARYVAAITGLEWSFSAHAKDIWTTPERELADKIADARFGVTCTAVNRDHLEALSGRTGKVRLVYHGLDLADFPKAPARPSTRERHGGKRKPDAPLRILSVCRAVEKKGLDDVLRALAALPADIDWQFEHIGGGALEGRLTALAGRLGVQDRVTFRGPLPRPEVVAALDKTDVFVLASRIARSGDRDGLPNVLMEAQAMGLAIVATNVSAVPEVIEDGRTGVLVPPRDRQALRAAITELARDADRRTALGRAAAESVRKRFCPEPGFDTIAALLTERRRQAA